MATAGSRLIAYCESNRDCEFAGARLVITSLAMSIDDSLPTDLACAHALIIAERQALKRGNGRSLRWRTAPRRSSSSDCFTLFSMRRTPLAIMRIEAVNRQDRDPRRAAISLRELSSAARRAAISLRELSSSSRRAAILFRELSSSLSSAARRAAISLRELSNSAIRDPQKRQAHHAERSSDDVTFPTRALMRHYPIQLCSAPIYPAPNIHRHSAFLYLLIRG